MTLNNSLSQKVLDNRDPKVLYYTFIVKQSVGKNFLPTFCQDT
ncbi:hypothetical protein HMPREF0322_01077 [Desulfitobacterium hafniense DP7]|uniref:Uncharacterized protein n=1 Tax=Desulfitobacterium hafniense DP7 TaxID=537010 RepID=G9XJE6_DESHA|nr:hypothetical protein HMPREF0322_01077 [Desulfitobacterium hafniense DP7]